MLFNRRTLAMIDKRRCLRLCALTAVLLGVLIGSSAFAATITVNSLADTGSFGACVLRDAITAANTMSATNGCAAGSGNDAINFSVTGTITLASALPPISRILTIGPRAPGITISGGGLSVNSGAQLSVRFLTLINAQHAIGNFGTLTVTRTTFANNGVVGAGAAISNSGTLTVSYSTFTNNLADRQCLPEPGLCLSGGAIFNSKTAIITTSTFEGNVARGCFTGRCLGGEGGAIFNSGTLSVAASTFSQNSTVVDGPAGEGGAIFNTGTLSVTNSTLSRNSAPVDGGAIFNTGPTPALITNSTFSGNFAPDGGAVFGPAKIKGSILAASISGVENCSTPPPTDIGYNISNDNSCGFTQTGSANNLDPQLSLAGLANNGGPTQTIALQSGSPAIDTIPLADCTNQALIPSRITIDQRGFNRPDARGEPACDIGAYESGF
jgi:hypothetical protein